MKKRKRVAIFALACMLLVNGCQYGEGKTETKSFNEIADQILEILGSDCAKYAKTEVATMVFGTKDGSDSI